MSVPLQVLVGVLCFAFAAWAISTFAVVFMRAPNDYWRLQRIPPNGEYVLATDGAELMVRSWVPEGSVHEVVLGVHGLGQHSGYLHRLGTALAAAGTCFYAVDLRGNGLTRTPHGDIPSVSRIYCDLDDLVGMLRQRHPHVQLFVLGHSMGAATVACWAAERSPRISGLLILAPAITASAAPAPYQNYIKGPASWLLFPHRPVLAISKDAYDRDRLAKQVDLPDQVDLISDDPLHLQRMSMAFALAANRFRKTAVRLAPRISLPTLTLVGDLDPARTGAERFHHSLTVADRAYILVPGATHFLFHIRKTPQVVGLLAYWLRAHAREGSEAA